MSAVLLHVGQAGCQLAQALWPALAQERPASPDLFYPSAAGNGFPQPRAVLVDGEPKVVEAALAAPRNASAAGFAFDSSAAAWSQSGRGGNFALGYAGDTNGPDLLRQALDCTRQQVERCHGSHLGTVVFHSLGGGTGSGLGSRLVEELRTAYPRSPLLTCSMLPITEGENPVQSYNALLATATLQELADGVFLYENDRLLVAAEKAPRGGGGAAAASGGDAARPGAAAASAMEGTSLAAMNGVVVRDLVPAFCPAVAAQPLDLGELLSAVCPIPTHSFVQAFSGEASAPYGPFGEVPSALEALFRTTPRMPRAAAGASGSVLAGQASVRGASVPDPEKSRLGLLEKLGGSVPWQPFALEMRCSAAPLRTAPTSTRVSVLLNWKRVANVLRPVVARARSKYASRMFAHWYDRHGFGPDAFAQAFEVLDGVIADYEGS